MEAANVAEIVSRVLAGDKDSYMVLINTYKGPVFNLAYRLTGSIQEAEDLSQETFLKAYSKLYQFNPQRNFFTWVYSISLNLIRNHLKRRKKAGFSEVTENSLAADSSPERDTNRISGNRDTSEMFQSFAGRFPGNNCFEILSGTHICGYFRDPGHIGKRCQDESLQRA